MNYYVDTCIYLNLWKRETRQGMPFWKFAFDFLEKVKLSKNIIYYSDFILKELSFQLTEKEFEEKTKIFHQNHFKKIFISRKEYGYAREIESEINFEISFFDILHLLLAKQTRSILVTRDNKLISIAKRYDVKVGKSEDFTEN